MFEDPHSKKIKLNSTFEADAIKIDYEGDIESFKQLIERIIKPFEEEGKDLTIRVKLNLKIKEVDDEY